jgi:integrase
MSVRKRAWKNRDGSQGEAWVVAYTDRAGTRRLRTFDRKRTAESFEVAIGVDVRSGVHVPDSQSIVIAEAAKLWLKSCEAAGLERTTLAAYSQHVALHIVPLIGAMKLSQLSAPAVRAFEDALRRERSTAMVHRVIGTLGAILADAQDRGLVAQNVVRGRPRRRNAHDKRQGKLKIGIDIPTPKEVRAIIAHLEGRWRPLLLTAIFTGLRASELRGLRWSDVDFKRGELHVRQRADHYNTIGRLKSEPAERAVPLPPMVVNTLREWKHTCPKGSLDLVFPNGHGHVENYSNIIKRGLIPIVRTAGVVNGDGEAKYSGLHSLRHFYASWCINRRVDGGLELSLKLVQSRLGHASIQMTADTYGHLFPRGDDGSELAAAERVLMQRA